jgi:hypothetical protein
MTHPYLYLTIAEGWPAVIRGDRDALVTLRSAIDQALHHERGEADVVDEDGEDNQVVVLREGS